MAVHAIKTTILILEALVSIGIFILGSWLWNILHVTYIRSSLVPCSFLIHAGIGRAVVKALAQCGAEVIAFSRTQADLDSLKTEVRLSVYACIAQYKHIPVTIMMVLYSYTMCAMNSGEFVVQAILTVIP